MRYSRTKLHHVIFWEHDGPSNLDNFLPVCEQHHQKIHNDHWQLQLTPNRQLTITFPDSTIMTTGHRKKRRLPAPAGWPSLHATALDDSSPTAFGEPAALAGRCLRAVDVTCPGHRVLVSGGAGRLVSGGAGRLVSRRRCSL